MASFSFNQVAIGGNMTRRPEAKYLPSGAAVVEFAIAVNERRKKGDEWYDEVSYVDCTAFGRTAEVICEYLDKGSAILVSGRLQQDRWETKEGQKRSKLKVMVERMQMVGGRPSRDEYSEPVEDTPPPRSASRNKDTSQGRGSEEEDDIPF